MVHTVNSLLLWVLLSIVTSSEHYLHLINTSLIHREFLCSGEVSCLGFLSVWRRPLLAAGLQHSSLRAQMAQLPRRNQISLSSSSSSSLMLVAATKVFLLFTTTSSTIPYRTGVWYSSCGGEEHVTVNWLLGGDFIQTVCVSSDIWVKQCQRETLSPRCLLT